MTNILLVGAGNIAQSIHLPILTSIAGVQVIGIVDKQIAKAKIVAEKYGVPNAYRSIAEAVKQAEVHGAVITSSTDAHAENALECIAAGLHVFIERPAARTLAETQQIQNAAADKDVQVMIGMNHRFRPDVVRMKNAVSRGEIGQVFYAKVGWVKQRSNDARWSSVVDKSGGGVLMDLGVSLIDLMLHVFEKDRVRSVVANSYHHETKSVEDIVISMIQFESGSVATLETSWSLMRAEDLFYCNVFGKKGSAYINPYKLVKRVGSGFTTTQSPQQKPQASAYRKSYEAELKHFASSIRGIIPLVSTIDEAVERMKVIEAMYASAELNREIVIP
ncbi:MAG: Gfo/Idh/MocA family oxidoreductase [Bradyrhizobiaceae bacterium]|nr:Gfo/Idh/MocA family oxidoreductase [Bradyrhizobiaceae bacterium]